MGAAFRMGVPKAVRTPSVPPRAGPGRPSLNQAERNVSYSEIRSKIINIPQRRAQGVTRYSVGSAVGKPAVSPSRPTTAAPQLAPARRAAATDPPRSRTAR
jgi:hypothetical protein